MRAERAKEGLEDCKNLLKDLVAEWPSLSDFMKEQMIACHSINFYLCDSFMSITQEFVETTFLENGGWVADHPFVVGVVDRLKSWNALR